MIPCVFPHAKWVHDPLYQRLCIHTHTKEPWMIKSRFVVGTIHNPLVAIVPKPDLKEGEQEAKRPSSVKPWVLVYLVIRTSCGETWPQTLDRNFFLCSGRRRGGITETGAAREGFLLDEQKSSRPRDALRGGRGSKRNTLYICMSACVRRSLAERACAHFCVSHAGQGLAPAHFFADKSSP